MTTATCQQPHRHTTTKELDAGCLGSLWPRLPHKLAQHAARTVQRVFAVDDGDVAAARCCRECKLASDVAGTLATVQNEWASGSGAASEIHTYSPKCKCISNQLH